MGGSRREVGPEKEGQGFRVLLEGNLEAFRVRHRPFSFIYDSFFWRSPRFIFTFRLSIFLIRWLHDVMTGKQVYSQTTLQVDPRAASWPIAILRERMPPCSLANSSPAFSTPTTEQLSCLGFKLENPLDHREPKVTGADFRLANRFGHETGELAAVVMRICRVILYPVLTSCLTSI